MDTNEILDADFNDDFDDGSGPSIELISTNKFIVLFILSFGLYGIWWMYKMQKFFQQDESLDIVPAARAIFAIFFTYQLYEKIKAFANKNNIEANYPSSLLFIGYVILSLFSRLPDPYWMITFLSFFCHLQPISVFNNAIDNSRLYEGNMTSGYNSRQIVIIVVGVLFWGLVMIGILLPEP